MDGRYWEHFYNEPHPDLEAPSTFARFCHERLRPGDALFELGCGNGRDALYFASLGLRVVACDQSSTAIEHLGLRSTDHRFPHAPQFVAADFTLLDARQPDLDVVYSRFTLHAVTAPEASRALAWSHASLRPGGVLLIEVRSVLGSLYGKGQPAGRDAFLHDGHYRRFVRSDELHGELGALGFDVVDAIESDGLAVYKDDDPVVIRVVARKREALR